jgi:hypothetical protein
MEDEGSAAPASSASSASSSFSVAAGPSDARIAALALRLLEEGGEPALAAKDAAYRTLDDECAAWRARVQAAVDAARAAEQRHTEGEATVAAARLLDAPEVHIAPPASARFPLALMPVVQAQMVAANAAMSAAAAAAATSTATSTNASTTATATASAPATAGAGAVSAATDVAPLAALLASLASLSPLDLTHALLPAWSSSVLPRLPAPLVTAAAPDKPSPAALAAERAAMQAERHESGRRPAAANSAS